jgi:hypothetical protein
VRDDSIGGAPSAGSGLVGLRDRLAVLDGHLGAGCTSSSDRGTRSAVRSSVSPCGSAACMLNRMSAIRITIARISTPDGALAREATAPHRLRHDEKDR